MARQARKESSTGIFHVMMRGINHQNIFEEPEDYYQFIATLDRMRVHYDEDGSPSGINCTYYAYCLMSNHFHLLIREREERVGETIKRDVIDLSPWHLTWHLSDVCQSAADPLDEQMQCAKNWIEGDIIKR